MEILWYVLLIGPLFGQKLGSCQLYLRMLLLTQKMIKIYLTGNKEWSIVTSYSPDLWSWGNLFDLMVTSFNFYLLDSFYWMLKLNYNLFILMRAGDSKNRCLWRRIWEDFQYHQRGGRFRWRCGCTGEYIVSFRSSLFNLHKFAYELHDVRF